MIRIGISILLVAGILGCRGSMKQQAEKVSGSVNQNQYDNSRTDASMRVQVAREIQNYLPTISTQQSGESVDPQRILAIIGGKTVEAAPGKTNTVEVFLGANSENVFVPAYFANYNSKTLDDVASHITIRGVMMGTSDRGWIKENDRGDRVFARLGSLHPTDMYSADPPMSTGGFVILNPSTGTYSGTVDLQGKDLHHTSRAFTITIGRK